MVQLIRREFVVNVSRPSAWAYLARVEQWPSWAQHINKVDLDPPGELTSHSKGLFRLSNGIKSQFVMTEFDRPRSWKWVGPFLWLNVHYDHQFSEVTDRKTKLTWTVEAEGFGALILGRLFAAVYAANLDRAIPKLIEEMEKS